jgi:hypothetical protein
MKRARLDEAEDVGERIGGETGEVSSVPPRASPGAAPAVVSRLLSRLFPGVPEKTLAVRLARPVPLDVFVAPRESTVERLERATRATQRVLAARARDTERKRGRLAGKPLTTAEAGQPQPPPPPGSLLSIAGALGGNWAAPVAPPTRAAPPPPPPPPTLPPQPAGGPPRLKRARAGWATPPPAAAAAAAQWRVAAFGATAAAAARLSAARGGPGAAPPSLADLSLALRMASRAARGWEDPSQSCAARRRARQCGAAEAPPPRALPPPPPPALPTLPEGGLEALLGLSRARLPRALGWVGAPVARAFARGAPGGVAHGPFTLAWVGRAYFTLRPVAGGRCVTLKRAGAVLEVPWPVLSGGGKAPGTGGAAGAAAAPADLLVRVDALVLKEGRAWA